LRSKAEPILPGGSCGPPDALVPEGNGVTGTGTVSWLLLIFPTTAPMTMIRPSVMIAPRNRGLLILNLGGRGP
jgi:hypothetical protein